MYLHRRERREQKGAKMSIIEIIALIVAGGISLAGITSGIILFRNMKKAEQAQDELAQKVWEMIESRKRSEEVREKIRKRH